MLLSKRCSQAVLLSLLAGVLCVSQIAAQLKFVIPGTGFHINITVPQGITNLLSGGSSGSNGTGFNLSATDIASFLAGAEDYIGQAISNLTLPPELENLVSGLFFSSCRIFCCCWPAHNRVLSFLLLYTQFTLPNFDNFSFTFGGNCTFCPNKAINKSASLNGIPCSDWVIVSSLGVPDGSDQCVLLQGAAVESCGCPEPPSYTGKTCSVCPNGQEIGTNQGTFNDTIGVTCADLDHMPAVDGDKTCSVVSGYSSACACTPSSQTNNAPSTTSESYSPSIMISLALLTFLGAVISL